MKMRLSRIGNKYAYTFDNSIALTLYLSIVLCPRRIQLKMLIQLSRLTRKHCNQQCRWVPSTKRVLVHRTARVPPSRQALFWTKKKNRKRNQSCVHCPFLRSKRTTQFHNWKVMTDNSIVVIIKYWLFNMLIINNNLIFKSLFFSNQLKMVKYRKNINF